MSIFIKLSEGEKRVVFALLILLVLVIALVAFIGYIIVKVMKAQGKKIDTLVSDVVTTKVITNKKDFFPYARVKNRELYFRQSIIPIIFIIIATIILIVYDSINKDFSYNPFNTTDGFGTLIYTFDFNDPDIYQTFFGIKIIADWPKVDNSPHFVAEAWGGYVSVFFGIIGIAWYFLTTQGFIARKIRIHKLAKQIFEKPLDNFNQNTSIIDAK